MSRLQIAPLRRVTALMLYLLLLPASPASACRGDSFIEQESSSIVRDLLFPDLIEGLPRGVVRIPTSTCGPSNVRFSVLYGNGTADWAEIIVFDWSDFSARRRYPEASLEEVHRVLTDIGHKLAIARNRSSSSATSTLLSTSIGGNPGLSFLTRANSGAEFKTIHLAFLTPSKSIRIEYNTFQLSSAEDKALAFRNSYLTHLGAFLGVVLRPSNNP